MSNQNDRSPARPSRVDHNLEELAQQEHDARQLSGQVSGTSEETAELFSSKETLIPYQ